MSKCRLLVASALACVGVLAGGVARANHGADSPVYTYPAPVYTQPAPKYTQPYPAYRGDDPYSRPYRHHRYYREPTHWDHDGDGIPNRRDRLYNPRWDVDGDGIPNRHDRDREGDGIPNWHDHREYRYWRN